MSRLHLPDVTLVATASTPEYLPGTLRAIKRCCDKVQFGNLVLFTSTPDAVQNDLFIDAYTSIVKIEPFTDYGDDSVACFKAYDYADLYQKHILAIGWDGFVVNTDAWDDRFLEYDWVGAPWPDNVVGNAGFSLISRRLLTALCLLEIPLDAEHCHPSDARICREEWRDKPGYRSRLEAMGLRWPDPELARKFSVENEPYNGSFGFHGRVTLTDVVFKGVI